MWRIERSLLIPAVSVLLIAGLLVPAGAAPPNKSLTPVWTITEEYNQQGDKVVTLKGVIPAANPKVDLFTVYLTLRYNCLCTSGCAELDPLNQPAPMSVYYWTNPTNNFSGDGWAETGELTKSGLTVTVVLSKGFTDLPGLQFVEVEVIGVNRDTGVWEAHTVTSNQLMTFY